MNAGDTDLTSRSGRSTGEGNGNPFQYSCLGSAVDRGAWQATVHGGHKRVRHDLAAEQQKPSSCPLGSWIRSSRSCLLRLPGSTAPLTWLLCGDHCLWGCEVTDTTLRWFSTHEEWSFFFIYINISFYFFNFYFILEYSWLTMLY